MIRKIIILIIFILLMPIFNASALDVLSLAIGHDNLGWKLKYQKQDMRNADLCFSKAINYYREYIDKTELTVADIETRRFTAFEAQKRIVFIYKFGLLDVNKAKKEFQKLLNMYAQLKAKFKTNKIVMRIESKIPQLNTEFKHKGYIVDIDKDNVFSLFLSKFSGDELIIYQELIPIARAKIKEIKTINSTEIIVKAQVFCKNPIMKVRPFCNVEVTKRIVDIDDKKAGIAEKYYNTGKALFETREFEDAQENFWLALKYNPNYKEALNMLGLTYFYYQDIENAKKLYGMALEIDPSYLEAFINLAGAYLGSSEFPIDTNNVLDMLEGSLAINQNYVRVYYWLGHFLDDFMFFDRAKKYYQEGIARIAVLTIDDWYKEVSLKNKLSSPGQIYWDTANIYLQDKEPMLNSSIYVFDELLKLNPDDSDVRKRINDISKVCPFARDSSLYRQVILHRRRGLELAKQNRLKEAIDEIRISLYLDQIITSEFRRCIRKIPRIRID